MFGRSLLGGLGIVSIRKTERELEYWKNYSDLRSHQGRTNPG